MRVKKVQMITGFIALGLLAADPAVSAAAAAKVVLDAGHGGSDPGAVGVNGLYEKVVNLDVVLKLRDELVKRGYEVYLTRDRDTGLSLAERVEYTNSIMPDLFVSVHANSHTSSSARGSMVLYYDKDYPQSDYPASDAMIALSPESKRLAQLVQAGMVREAGTVDKGLVPSAVYVARMGSVPSILVETAFLSNAQDAALLADAGFQQKLALGIADGIVTYKPSEPFVPGAFSDVSITHWANEAIEKLKAKGIVEGEYGRFYPDRPLTRAEFVVMLERQFTIPDLTGCTKETAADGTSTESATGTSADSAAAAGEDTTSCQTPVQKPADLPSSHWAYESMMNAVQKGLLSGYADGTLRPDRSLTRGEAAALIDRVIYPGSSQVAGTSPFEDVPKTLWSAAAINRLKSKGIIDGVTATTFVPERAITRAEMSALLARLIK